MPLFMGSDFSRSIARRGMTLIEVCVAVASVAALSAFVLATAASVRARTLEVRDAAAMAKYYAAHADYVTDNAGAVVVAAPAWSWVHPGGGNPPPPVMRPTDPTNAARKLQGSSAKPWTFHLADGRLKLREVMIDAATATTFNTRSPFPSVTTSSPPTADYSTSSLVSSYSYHPSFGMNGVFVGGSFRHGGYSDGTNNTTNVSRGGHFYVRFASQVVNPAGLILFTSTRGGDVATSGSYWNYGAIYPDFGTRFPGYWLATPPRAGGLSGYNVLNWNASNTFDPNLQPSRWGNVDFRYRSANKPAAMTAMFDGSVKLINLPNMRDMRLWATQATGATWQWSSGQNPPNP